jgi:Mannosyl-glycoprotein endo-beta-N-acetylglucosaminidase.
MGNSLATANQMNQFIRSKNPDAPLLADIYLQMEQLYGVRADIAFCQMCKETKYQMFGGQVKAEQHNPAGLGAVDNGAQGETYPDWPTGIEAQFQHLLAYASTNQLPLNRVIYDIRFKYVNRGTAPWVESLGIQENPQHVGWASDHGYGISIVNDYLAVALKMPDIPVVEPQSQVKPEPVPEATPLPTTEKEAPQVEPAKPVQPVAISWLSLFLQFLNNFIKGGKK